MALDSDPSTLKVILEQEVDRWNWQRAKWIWVVKSHWHLVVGDYLADHSLLASLDRNSVVIAVPASTWAQELTYWKPEISRRLDEITHGETAASEIRVRVWPNHFVGLHDLKTNPPGERGFGYRFVRAPDVSLLELAARVQDKHRQAVEYWMKSGYVSCEKCTSPTLQGYRFCAACELGQADPLMSSAARSPSLDKR